MKKTLLIQLITICSMFFANQICAQTKLNHIDSLKIIPTSPTTNDEIKIIYYNTFFSSPNWFQDFEINIQDGQIEITLRYRFGISSAFSRSVDTISIGCLPPNSYSLKTIFKLYSTENISIDDYIATFTVEEHVDIAEMMEDNFIGIFPNPFNSKININTDLNIEKVEIYSLDGKRIALDNKYKKGMKQIDLSYLKSGVYFIALTDEEGRKYAQKIIKDNL